MHQNKDKKHPNQRKEDNSNIQSSIALSGPKIGDNIIIIYYAIEVLNFIKKMHETMYKENYTEVNRYIILAYISN